MQTRDKKRILYVITKSNFGGAQRYVYELATSLPKYSFDVTVAFGGSGLLKQKLEEAGIKTRAIHSFERDINFIKEFKSLFELHTLIRQIKPDIVHLNSSKAGGSGALIARLSGVPKIIFTAHGWPFHEARNIFWKSVVWKLSWITALLSHTIILVSAYDKKHSWMPFTKNKAVCIHTAIPSINFHTQEKARQVLFNTDILSFHTNDIWLATTAELTPNKNILVAIKAVESFNKNNPNKKIFYTILGDGELLPVFKNYIKEHHLECEIYLAGYISNARIYLKAFDIFLLPSFKEGMPYALLEAGAANLACIASNVGGIPEIIDDGINGILINPKDQKTIELALQTYIENPSLQKEHASALKTKIDTNFGIEKMLKETIEIYTKKTN